MSRLNLPSRKMLGSDLVSLEPAPNETPVANLKVWRAAGRTSDQRSVVSIVWVQGQVLQVNKDDNALVICMSF